MTNERAGAVSWGETAARLAAPGPSRRRTQLFVKLRFGGDGSIVTTVKFALADLSRPEALPAVCVRCGRKAAGFRGMRLTTSEPQRPSSWGWLLWELGLWTWQEKATAENLLHEWRITRGRLKLPVCWWHRWVAPPLIGAGLVNDRTVALYGVSDGFVAAMKRQGKVR